MMYHLFTCTFEPAHDGQSVHMYIWVSSWWSIYKHVHLSQLMMVHLYTCTFESAHDGPSIHMYIWASSWWFTYTHVHLSQVMVVHLYTCTFESAHYGPPIHKYIWAKSRDGVLILVLVLVLTRVLFSSTWLYSVLSEIHEYMYSYLLKYCYKKPCTHEYITSTTEYFFKFQSDRETVHCFSDPHSSVSNSPHLSFFIFEKSGLIWCQNQNLGIAMLEMNKKAVPICFEQIKKEKSGLICLLGK